jgi:hypothetical protein
VVLPNQRNFCAPPSVSDGQEACVPEKTLEKLRAMAAVEAASGGPASGAMENVILPGDHPRAILVPRQVARQIVHAGDGRAGDFRWMVARTRAPRSMSAGMRFAPTNPVAPVTKMFLPARDTTILATQIADWPETISPCRPDRFPV